MKCLLLLGLLGLLALSSYASPMKNVFNIMVIDTGDAEVEDGNLVINVPISGGCDTCDPCHTCNGTDGVTEAPSVNVTDSTTIGTTDPPTPPPYPCVDFTTGDWNPVTLEWECECIVGYAGDPFVDCGEDSDLDGYPDFTLNCSSQYCTGDNCPQVPNSGQEDCDADGLGDACDSTQCVDPCSLPGAANLTECQEDTDNDGVIDEDDNCPYTSNQNQLDTDGDGLGDVCDNCPKDSNPGQEDEDKNFIGDACESTDPSDVDGDGIPDDVDNCPQTPNPNQLDSDLDGQGDVCDDDDDNDQVPDTVDNCPFCYNPQQEDSDGDGVGDVCEDDQDCDCIKPPCGFDPCPGNNQISMVNFNDFKMVALDPITSGQNDPNWEIHDHGKEIVQTLNSDPGLAIGADNFEGVDYEGTIFVNTQSDDDYIGVVFGYRDSSNFYVVTWKKGDQTSFWGNPTVVAERRVQVKAVHSITGPGPELKTALWNSESTPDQVTVLFSSEKMGWQPFVAYRWEIQHRPSTGLIKVKMFEGANLVIDTGALTDFTHQGGRLGVYCFSQEDIHWSNLYYSCNEDPVSSNTTVFRDHGNLSTLKQQVLRPWTLQESDSETNEEPV